MSRTNVCLYNKSYDVEACSNLSHVTICLRWRWKVKLSALPTAGLTSVTVRFNATDVTQDNESTYLSASLTCTRSLYICCVFRHFQKIQIISTS